MRAPEFEAMIGPARLYPQFWRLILGILLILFCYLGGVALLAGLAFAAMGPFEFMQMMPKLQQPAEPLPTLALLATFVPLLLGVVVAAAALHFRGPGTLIGPRDETLRGFVTVLAVTVPVYGLLFGLGAYFGAYVPNLALDVWLRALVWAIPLIFVQVAAEELAFRGYIQQQLAARFRARVIWMFLPALVFSLLHIAPGLGPAVWLVVLATFTFGVIAADLTERTGSLGAAVGLHFVNNVYGLTVISLGGSITGLAKWTTPFTQADTREMIISLGFNVVFLALVWRLIRWALDR